MLTLRRIALLATFLTTWVETLLIKSAFCGARFSRAGVLTFRLATTVVLVVASSVHAPRVTAAFIPFATEASFVGAAGPLTIESFESSSGSGLSSLITPNLSLSHTGSTFSVLSAPSPFGTSATDGVRFLEEDTATTNQFIFSGFAGPLSAFGLNVTDYGDFGSDSLVMTINGTTSFTIAAPSGPSANGSVLYFGVMGTAGDTITEVRLGSGDAIGIDKVGISAAVPEPGTAILSLLGLIAIGVVASRRRTPAAQAAEPTSRCLLFDLRRFR